MLAADPGFPDLRRRFPEDREVRQRSSVVVEVDTSQSHRDDASWPWPHR